ncbi:TOMM precursor leader peptide-binding protein [Saccharomonospora piscinae]|uniref:TOMM precursor leader peptide-binding protein n=1 Tax=Saccharomonospora piscinae TaxID=687388 RepID=UPI000467A2F2|nr:TOMM precursor leader peptide-binding protein [Saccharomonospora piscinae]
MAAAIPLELALVGVGVFGDRVCAELAESHGRATIVPDVEQAFRSGCDAVVVCAWRPAPEICARADVLAHDTRVPWLPVVREDPVVQLGPFVVPGEGACYRCYADRRRQHEYRADHTDTVYAAYDRDHAIGPGGFLPQHCRLAAGFALDVLGRRPLGRVTTVSLWKPQVMTHHVVSVNGCERCARPAPNRTVRSLLRLGGEGVDV